MIASLRGEFLKSRKRWANWILFGFLLLLVLGFGYGIAYLVTTHPPRRFESPVPAAILKRETYPENLLANVLNWTPTIGAAIMIILGGLSTASEYGWSTIQTILMQKPRRSAVLAGKLANLAIITVVYGVVLLGAAALVSYFLVSIDHASSSWPSSTTLLKGVGALLLELTVWTAFGMFLGVAFRSTAAAIGGGLVYVFVVEAIFVRLFSNTDVIDQILKFLPGVNSGSINAAFPLTFHNAAAETPLVSVGRGVTTVVVYIVVFTLLAFIIFDRRDVTGAGG